METEYDEADWIKNKIKNIKTNDPDSRWSDFAILIRANASADIFFEELNRSQIPNTFVSLKGLYYKSIILDIIAYFRLLDNFHESGAVFRMLNADAFKIDPRDIIKLNRFARTKSISLFEALDRAKIVPEINKHSLENIQKLIDLVKKHSLLAQKASPGKILIDYINDAKIFDGRDYDEDQEFFSLVNQFYQKIKRFEEENMDVKLKDFMNLMDLEMEAGENSKITKKKLKDFNFPKGAIIGAVSRNNSSEISVGETQIKPHDRVIVFALPEAISEVEKIFD